MTLPDAPLELQDLLQNLEHIKDVGGNAYMADCPVPSPLPHSVAFGENGTGLKLQCYGESQHTREQIVDAMTGVGLPVLQTNRAEDWHPFPSHAIPKSLLELATEAATEGGYPPEFVIVPGLSVLAGAIGATHAVIFSTTWVEYPVLWTGIVAAPGAGKSPALSLVVAPLREFDNGLLDTWRPLQAAWQETERKKKKSDDTEPRPILRRTLCSNITMEAQVELLAENPRGLLRAVDEVSEVMGGLNQYKTGKGADRQQILTMWSSDRMQRDRIKEGGPVVVDHPVCSITGGMQPSKVNDFLSGDDGMSERWLLGHFADIKVEKPGKDANPITIQHWNRLVLSILNLEYSEDTKFCSLAPEAQELWSEFKERNRQRFNQNISDRMKSYWQKLNRHVGRLTVVLHVAEAAEKELKPDRWVQRETVEHAIHIAEWFADQYQQNLPREENLMQPPSLSHRDKAVATLREFIIRKGGKVSRKDIQMGKPASARTPEQVNQLIAWYSEVYPEDVIGNNQFQIKEMQ